MNNEAAIKQFLKNKKILIASENTTDRTSWKKIFLELGATTINLLNANSLDEALDIFHSHEVDIIFSAYNFGEQSTIELVELHNQKYPDRSEYIYIIISDKNSLAVAACAAEHDIDALIIKPYNINDLILNITTAITKKIELSKEMRFFYQVKKDIVDGDYKQAQIKAEKLLENKPKSPNATYLLGLIQYQQGSFDQAIELWKKALEHDPLHHKSLCKIFDTFIEMKMFVEAYPYAEILCDKYPINPERIPNFIRVSLATKTYQNLIDFCQMILEVESNLKTIQRPIAAALAISAKNLAGEENHYEIVKSASLKAMELTDPKSKIYFTCLENLLMAGDYHTAQAKIDEIPTDEMSLDLHFLELKILFHSPHKSHEAFIKAQGLYKLNYKSSDFYKILIQTSIDNDKKKAYIEDLIFEAIKLYPREEKNFKNYLS